MPSVSLPIDRRIAMPTIKPRDLETADDRRAFAAALSAARQEFVAGIERGAGGLRAHGRFAECLDDLIVRIVGAARVPTSGAVAVAALGGYGRRALCLHSDIDLLIVFERAIGAAEEQFVKQVLHPLWDLRLTTGHQVRVLADFDELERDNPEYLLALLDARLIVGDLGLFRLAQERFRGSSAGYHEEMLEALLRLTEERHHRFNDTIYQLEPDIKESPGALRDVAAARVVVSLTNAPASASAIERDRLEQAEDFFLRIRGLLHLEAGRNANVLGHELQEKVAERLRYPGAQRQQRVEALMGTYFRHARDVARALDRVRRLAGPSERDTTTVPLGLNLQQTADGISFVDAERAASEPASWVPAFDAALRLGVRIADDTLDMFERHAPRYSPVDFLPEPIDRAQLVQLLQPRRGLYARLSDMQDCGLLNRLFPEFQAISSRVIRDFYHKYTVDEHTLLTIRGIERLLAPDSPTRWRFGSLLKELPSPELLVLALLFHDVGKWKDDNHAEESVRMAQSMLDRLDVPPDRRQDVEFLIAQHLQMSRVAFRRDSEDPVVVREFAALVGTEVRLKMLCLMTLADVEAVRADTLTPWREELLWRLYVDAYNQLTVGYADTVIQRGQAAVSALQATRPDDLTDDELARFLEGFPQRYLAMFESPQIYRHARLSRNIRPDEVHLFLERKGQAWELAVVTLDKPFLFANISGVLSYFGMDILRGSAMTSPGGLVLDIFQFIDHEGFFRINPESTPQFEKLLQDVVAGRNDVTTLLQRKESGALRPRTPLRVKPVVSVDNERSQRYTVLEIVAQDALGLLHRISRAVSCHGCDVDLVLISTEGNKAIDVFHVTKAAVKLSEPAQMALKEDLQRMLEEGYETR